MADDKKFTEDAYEQTLIALFRDELGYAYECGYEVERDYREPFHRADLVASMRRLNPSLPADAMEQGIKQITNISIGTLEQNNEQFTLWMQNGLEVGYLQDGEERTTLMRLIDYERPERNLFKVVNQWRVEEYKNKRCDMVVMVNGLPLVVVELKSAVSEDATIDDAYKQIKNYQQSIPSLFSYNAFNVISDMSETRAGTITAKEARYMEWKTVDGSYESTLIADYRTFFLGMFQKQRLLDILQNYICFDKNQGRYAKILTAYHQYYAVGKALERTKEAVEGNGKIGVFWHTQGSGKSLSMVFYAHQLVQRLPEVTIVVVTDRKDLDNQLFGQFCRCKDFLRQEPVNAQSRNDLGRLLQGRQSGGVIFTTIQKFEEGDTPLSPRRNIIVMSDEAHRSQYGDEHWDAQSQRMKKGFSQKMREALPGASFIGFTGTPISDRDRDTEEVFGHYIDIYDMSQAVDDGATRPVYYESRVVNLRLDDDPMKIAIVRDMWLTGFDVPSLATMYVYKPMSGHNLMQAIARVNRVFPGKEGGLIVDYVGIAQALKSAMQQYTNRDRHRFGDPDIAKTALLKWREEMEVCRDQLHGFDYTGFFAQDNTKRAAAITAGANYLSAPALLQKKKDFMEHSALLHNATTLCRSLLDERQKTEVCYMDALRVMMLKLSQKGKISRHEINERIGDLLRQSVKTDGVINLFGDRQIEFSLFDEAFLQEVKNMKERNLAVELLTKLLKERIRQQQKTNITQSDLFSDMLSRSLSNYLKGLLTNEEVIQELLKMAQQMKHAEDEGNDLGLTSEEKAFYDALSTPEGVRQAYSDEEFVALTKELTEVLHTNRTIEWNRKESARAKMRVLVKRLLKKYKYPPEGAKKALETVMRQCDHWADDDENVL